MLHVHFSRLICQRKKLMYSSSTYITSCNLPAAAGCVGLLSLSDPHREAFSFPHTTAGDGYVLSPTVCFSSSRYPCPPSAVIGHSAVDCAMCCHGTERHAWGEKFAQSVLTSFK